MADLLTRIQNWYKTNCDGDWEHSYGFSINTLDNPGWWVRIDLQDTALENLEFSINYQNKENEQDWFFIRTDKKVFDVNCGPANLNRVFSIFLEEIIPKYADPNVLYEIYVPITGPQQKVWTLAKGRMITENRLELVELPALELRNVMVRNLSHIYFDENNMQGFSHQFKVGDQVLTELEDMWDGVKLTVKEIL
jgi:hypothetical protein